MHKLLSAEKLKLFQETLRKYQSCGGTGEEKKNFAKGLVDKSPAPTTFLETLAEFKKYINLNDSLYTPLSLAI